MSIVCEEGREGEGERGRGERGEERERESLEGKLRGKVSRDRGREFEGEGVGEQERLREGGIVNL